MVKGIIRRGEAKNTCRFVGVPNSNAHFLNLPFYETGLVEKNPIGEADYVIISNLIEEIQPHKYMPQEIWPIRMAHTKFASMEFLKR